MGLWSLFSNVYAVFSMLSFVTFIIVWLIANWQLKDKRRATVLAGDITNVFLIGAVAAELDLLFPNGLGGIWILLLVFLIAAGLIGGAQSRLKGQVNVKKLVRIIWRLSFIVLAFLYILLAIIIFIKYLF